MERIIRISQLDQRHIAAAAHAVRLGATRNYIEVAIETGYHPVDAAGILRLYSEIYNPVTVQFYGREVL